MKYRSWNSGLKPWFAVAPVDILVGLPTFLLAADWVPAPHGLLVRKKGFDGFAVNGTDMEDIRGSLEGDGGAYARLVERHQAKVASQLWRFTRDKAHHEELVQDVFVEAFLSLKTYRGEAPFEHWVAKITTAVGYRYWKNRTKERQNPSVPIEEWLQIPEDRVDAMDPSEAADLLHRLLDRLPARDRLVLMLRYVEDLTVEETADRTGWTQTMVKVQAWRARGKLKRLFQEAGLEVVQ